MLWNKHNISLISDCSIFEMCLVRLMRRLQSCQYTTVHFLFQNSTWDMVNVINISETMITLQVAMACSFVVLCECMSFDDLMSNDTILLNVGNSGLWRIWQLNEDLWGCEQKLVLVWHEVREKHVYWCTISGYIRAVAYIQLNALAQREQNMPTMTINHSGQMEDFSSDSCLHAFWEPMQHLFCSSAFWINQHMAERILN